MCLRIEGIAALLGLVWLAGCTHIPYAQKSAEVFEPVVKKAQVVDPSEVDWLTEAGYELIGEFKIAENSFRQVEGIRCQLLEQAAEVGATHVIVAQVDNSRELIRQVDVRVEHAESGSAAQQVTRRRDSSVATYSPTVTTATVRHSVYDRHGATLKVLGVRVDPERWWVLPSHLRPDHFLESGVASGRRRYGL